MVEQSRGVMPSGKPDLARAQAFFLDGDGVLYRGSQRLPGARRFLAALDEAGIPFLLVTNNATRTPDQVAEKLAHMDILIRSEQILTSALATAGYLLATYGPGRRILMVGEIGLELALHQAGYQLVDDHREAELVVAALDRGLNYEKLAQATLAIRRGCPFIATNPDRSIPSERGVEPGAGSVLALLEAASDVSPLVIGKPQPGIFQQALARLGIQAKDAVMVGDRYETDILGGLGAGIPTAAVLTGITTAREFAVANPPPTWVFADLEALFEAWQASRQAD